MSRDKKNESANKGKKEKPFKTDLSFEELLKLALNTPPAPKKKSKTKKK